MGLSFSILFSSWNGILHCNIFDFFGDSKGAKTVAVCSRSSSVKIGDSNWHDNMTLTRSLSFQDWKSIPSERPISPKEKNPVGAKRNHLETFTISKPTIVIEKEPVVFLSPKPRTELDAAATTVQKVYKSYRTRRNLADCAVLVEELWWKTLDSAALKRFSVSFFDTDKKETAASRWTRATARLAKVGKGLSKDEKAQKLALRHWLEAIDARHRYGHNLHLYFDIWFESKSTEPFFYWLDVGDGKEVSHDKCSRAELQRQCITYLGPKEREAFEVIVENGKLVYRRDGTTVNTTEGTKWIFVLSTSKSLYVGQKKKGTFQHSSFLSGAAITAAGRLVARDGTLEAIWPYSGHYLPTEDNFNEFIAFLKQNRLDLTNVKRCSVDDDDVSFKMARKASRVERESDSFADVDCVAAATAKVELEMSLKSPLARFNGSNRLSCKWTSGLGPRIGCVRDYPQELQNIALGHVSLSPRVSQHIAPLPIPSPRPSPKFRVSPMLAYMGLPSPRDS